MSLARALVAALPQGRLTSSGDVSRIVFEVDGCWLDGRVREHPVVEVFIRTLAIPGFRLRLRPTGDFPVRARFDPSSGYDEAALAAELEQRARDLDAGNVDVDASDDELRRLWVDAPAIDAAVAALWVRIDHGIGLGARIAASGYDLLVENGTVLVRRTSELDPARLARAVRAGAMLAARPHRIARAWHEIARDLGGTTTTDRWDLGGAFAATIDRGPTTVLVDNVRVLPGEDDDDALLRTRLRARRIAADADHWTFWSDAVARAHRPDVGRGARCLRDLDALREVAGPLVEDVAPDALWVDGDTLTMWWPGMVLDRARLGPAVELLARLAAPRTAATGPYR